MYYNEKHKEEVKNRGDNYSYIGSYERNEATLDGKNKNKNKVKRGNVYIRVKCPYCGKEYDVQLNGFKNQKYRCTNCCNKYENSFAYYIQQELKEPLNKYWDWEKNNELNISPYHISYGSNITIWIKCTKIVYHESYKTNPHRFLDEHRCPYCNNKKVHPKDSFAQWLINTYGDDSIKKYWSPKNTIDPWEIAPQSNKSKVWILCQEKEYHNDEGGYPTTPNDFFRGFRCPYCANRKVHPKDSFAHLYPEKAKYWSPNNDKSPYEVAPKSNDIYIYKFICEKCGEEFDRKLSKLNRNDNGVVCRECNSSQGETKILKWLDKNNIEYIHDKPYFNDLIGCGNGVLKPDFIIKDRKIWIEYDGEFHYKNIHNDDSLKKQQEHDKRKDNYAKKNNWKLIRIPYWEFDNIESILEENLKKY